MIKLVYNNKNKIIKHQNRSFSQLRELIRQYFPQAPIDYSLSYLDQDKDQICLNSEEDLVNMLNNNHLKTHKVYIKQSLSQTVVLDLERSDYVEPSFEVDIKEDVEERKEEKEENAFVKKEAEKVQEPTEVVAQEKQSQKGDKVQEKASSVIKAPKEEPMVEEKQEEEEKPAFSWKDKLIESDKAAVFSWADKLDEAEASRPYTQPKEESPVQVPQQEQKPEVKVADQPVDATKEVMIQADQLSAPSKVTLETGIQSQQIFIDPIKYEESIPRVDVTRARIFDKKEEPAQLSPKKNVQLLLHKVICSNCKDEFGILGIRYQCILCERFNLCSKCQDEIEHEHSLVKVKIPGKAIKNDELISKFKKELNQVEEGLNVLPPGHFVPSVNKEDARMIVEAAQEAYKQGMERSKKLMDQLFYKMEMSHKNPYEVEVKPPKKPVPPAKVETVFDKTKYLQDLANLSYNDALRFVNQHPRLSSEKIVQKYFSMKSF